MSRRRNIQLFALPEAPPEHVTLAGRGYKLLRVFKHDFFAATCLYVAPDEGAEAVAWPPDRVVVKFGRTQSFYRVGLEWYGRWLADHEADIYRVLRGVAGVPRWVGRVGATGYAMEYIAGRPLDHVPSTPPGFFEHLRETFEAMHARGVAYVDANKRSNIIVRSDLSPCVIDYQIAIRRRPAWPWPIGWLWGRLVSYMARRDIYHLYKHKRRMAPAELTPDEEQLSRSRGWVHRIHRRVSKAWRAVRRPFLRSRHQRGELVSPTAHLEDHHQPEKATWRQ
jgi:hypothetical protein